MGEYLGTLFNQKNQPKGGMKRVTFYIRNTFIVKLHLLELNDINYLKKY